MLNETSENTNLTHDEIVRQGIVSVLSRLENAKMRRTPMDTYLNREFLSEALIPEELRVDIIKDPTVQRAANEAMSFQYKIRNFNAALEIEKTFELDTRLMVLEDEAIRGDLLKHIKGFFITDPLKAADFADSFKMRSEFFREPVKSEVIIGLSNLFKSDEARYPADLLYYKNVFDISDDEFLETGKKAVSEFKSHDGMVNSRGVERLLELFKKLPEKE